MDQQVIGDIFWEDAVISVLGRKVSGLKNPVANCVLVPDYNPHHQQNFQMHAGNLSNLAPFLPFFCCSV
jgi:hypothetical protein